MIECRVRQLVAIAEHGAVTHLDARLDPDTHSYGPYGSSNRQGILDVNVHEPRSGLTVTAALAVRTVCFAARHLR